MLKIIIISHSLWDISLSSLRIHSYPCHLRLFTSSFIREILFCFPYRVLNYIILSFVICALRKIHRTSSYFHIISFLFRYINSKIVISHIHLVIFFVHYLFLHFNRINLKCIVRSKTFNLIAANNERIPTFKEFAHCNHLLPLFVVKQWVRHHPNNVILVGTVADFQSI